MPYSRQLIRLISFTARHISQLNYGLCNMIKHKWSLLVRWRSMFGHNFFDFFCRFKQAIVVCDSATSQKRWLWYEGWMTTAKQRNVRVNVRGTTTQASTGEFRRINKITTTTVLTDTFHTHCVNIHILSLHMTSKPDASYQTPCSASVATWLQPFNKKSFAATSVHNACLDQLFHGVLQSIEERLSLEAFLNQLLLAMN